MSVDAAVTPSARGDRALHDPATPATLADRIARLGGQAAKAGADAVIVSPGADLRYLLGHSVASHERLTCLVVDPDGTARLLVPAAGTPGLGRHAGRGPGPGRSAPGSTVRTRTRPWPSCSRASARVLSVDNYLPTMHALGLQSAVPGSELTLAGPAISELRMRKDIDEVAALAAVGAAIDRVQRRIAEWLIPGRTRTRGGRGHRGSPGR